MDSEFLCDQLSKFLKYFPSIRVRYQEERDQAAHQNQDSLIIESIQFDLIDSNSVSIYSLMESCRASENKQKIIWTFNDFYNMILRFESLITVYLLVIAAGLANCR